MGKRKEKRVGQFSARGRARSEDVKRLRYIGVFLLLDGRSQRFEKGRRKATVSIFLVPTTTNE